MKDARHPATIGRLPIAIKTNNQHVTAALCEFGWSEDPLPIRSRLPRQPKGGRNA
jgi:hypothetical protein